MINDKPKKDIPNAYPTRYYGGKWLLAPIISRIIDDLGSSVRCYNEPFGGGAAVLIHKNPSEIEYYNDKNERIVNFFRVVRDNGDELLRRLRYTMFSRVEFQRAIPVCEDDPIEDARRVFILLNTGTITPLGTHTHGRFYRYSPRETNKAKTYARKIEHIAWLTNRFRHVCLECKDGIEMITYLDTEKTLHYIDPPYLANYDQRYPYDMNEKDHLRLYSVLRNCKGKVIISGYSSDIYDNLYSGWRCIEKEISTSGHKKKGLEKLVQSKRLEKIWTNF